MSRKEKQKERKYPETVGKIALEKLVISQRIILAVDAKKILNRNDITCTINALVRQGRIKSKKVDVRYQDNTIRAMILLYRTNVKQSEMKKFEEQLLERTFIAEDTDTSEVKKDIKSKTNELECESNRLEYTVINGRGGILIREYNGNSVVTRNDIADFHEKPPFSLDKLISNNIHKLTKEIDYFVNGEELLFTKTGYLALTELFEDKLSLKVRKEMIKSYFRKCKIINDTEEESYPVYTNDLSGITKLMVDMTDKLNKRISELERKLQGEEPCLTVFN